MATNSDKPKRKVRGGSLLGNDWEQKTRQKLQASAILNRLIDHVNGEIKLETSQVTAGLGLLKKCLPDLSSVAMTGADGGALQVVVQKFTDDAANS